MKKIGYAVLSAAALLGVSSAQAAENLPWTYVEAAYNSLDGDEDDEPRALALAGSIGFLSKWHAQLEYLDGDVESDFEGQDPEFDGFRITVGAHPQITDKTQLLANIAYFDYEGDLDFDGGEGGEFDFGSDGLALGFGLRHAVSDKLELTGQVWYLDGDEFFGDDSEDQEDFNDTIIEFQGRYNWTPNLSTGLTASIDGSFAGVAASEADDTFRVDVRWAFGN